MPFPDVEFRFPAPEPQRRRESVSENLSPVDIVGEAHHGDRIFERAGGAKTMAARQSGSLYRIRRYMKIFGPGLTIPLKPERGRKKASI